MPRDDSGIQHPPEPHAGPRQPDAAVLKRVGLGSWYLLGIIAVIVVAALALSAVSGILVPLVIAAILGIVLEPVATRLKRWGVSATLATAITLLAAILVTVGMVSVVVWGFVHQWSEIYSQLLLGWDSFVAWGRDLNLDSRWLEHARSTFDQHAQQLGQGALGVVTSTFYGVLSLVMGTFFAGFFLFFVLRDASKFPAWLARSTGFDPDEVASVAAHSRDSVLGYFRGTAITAVSTAPIVMVPILVLQVPLAIPIFVLYFFLSFVPFVGAWITGIFAVLIAFGSGGPTAALIIGITFVISNGTIQSAISSWALGSSLSLHPVAVLLATLIGGTIAGLLGMVLGAPVLAAVTKSVAAVRQLRATAAPADTPRPDVSAAAAT